MIIPVLGLFMLALHAVEDVSDHLILERLNHSSLIAWLESSVCALLKPLKNGANTASGKGNARIRRAVIQVEGVAIGGNGAATRKDNFVHVPVPLVGFFRSKDPLVTAL